MAELSFAKTFLSQLDSKPVKLPANHVSDLRTFQPRQPFTLPRLSDSLHPPLPKKIKPSAIPGSSKSITIHLKSARSPALEITLDNISLSSATIQDLRDAVQARIKPANAANESEQVSLDKIKILWKRKPVQGKLVTDVLANEPDVLKGGKEVEFGVMILGGAVVVPPREPPAPAPVTAIPTKAGQTESPSVQEVVNSSDDAPSSPSTTDNVDILHSAAFWKDVESFLETKLKGDGEATRVASLFKKGWESSL
ncbi:hypothetical protein LOZ53_004831 [Ophidiomyces ophidiicola]|uniref:Uncharacterized protein n=1 Tax=Ophidiomyces ophidiicola TaxID=1387563 RepID=A0ACB8URQ3_9EURO|nr:uncharacterized protein LOZ57_000865 [Ophidiomyces ophidiicola]KAI1908234.1 hypothetical protein LOZ61_005703 [Ophidiomyces ophidiicola]KAI1926461.1 hypothetical protein LOZ64_000224 [Ophidiomyces ophidiicola]KAI1931642.1 hypothetical protein LOZ60_000177 [Ophidiomyces ophidiicola]KAI1940254.1 hypothetical protein LOZ62_004940 [Ophidiomyces ophidiicola]KAI1952782.1 hypothetical protein LOZ57_000865 [Ophidiomyces ophidiicola]